LIYNRGKNKSYEFRESTIAKAKDKLERLDALSFL